MKTVKYKISLKGLSTERGTISFTMLSKVVDLLVNGSERALRLAVEGKSVKVGTTPAWLSQSTEFVLKKIGKGSTVLEFEAPTLKETAQERIRQQDLWYTVPEPNDTAITLLSNSIRDAEEEKMESDRYDRGMLDTLLGFRQILENDKIKIELRSRSRLKDNFTIDAVRYKNIERVRTAAPESQAVLVSGYFNVIEHSERKFTLTLENKQTVHGKIDEGLINVEEMRRMWGKKVTIKGTVHYLASGKPRMLEAHHIQARQVGDEILASLPMPVHEPQLSFLPKSGTSSKGIVHEIWGKWPGDESIEELLEELHKAQ